MIEYKDYYKTSSLALAAAIVATSRATLSDVLWHDGKGYFVFENSQTLVEIIESFWRKELACDCSVYFDALKYVKNRLYERRGEI